jgi:hypothetical protein
VQGTLFGVTLVPEQVSVVPARKAEPIELLADAVSEGEVPLPELVSVNACETGSAAGTVP